MRKTLPAALLALAACTSEQQKVTAGVTAPAKAAAPAAKAEVVRNLPTLPGATVLGLGYDPTQARVFRNRVLAADLDVAPEAWGSPEQGGLYYYAETDRRYVVPKHVMLLPQHQRSEVEFTIAESKSAFARKVSANMKASGGYGLFSGSVESSFDSSTRNESESMFAQRTERIYLWSVWLTPVHDLDPGFRQRLDALPTEITPEARDAYQALIDDYGVAAVSYAALGGRLDYNQTMAKQANQSEEDIKAKVSASYGASFNGSASASTSISSANASSQTDTSVEVFGGNAAEAGLLMEKGGDLVPWSVSVPKDPAVVDVELIDLWKLVEPGPRRDELERAVYRHGRRANPTVPVLIKGSPVPDIYLDDGDRIEPPDVPNHTSADHLRVTVLDARNLEVRDDRYFYSLAGGVPSSVPNYPSLDAMKQFLTGIGPDELVIVTSYGDTGALQLRKDLQDELRALGAKAAPKSGPYVLIGGRDGNTYEQSSAPTGGHQALLIDDATADRYRLAIIGGVPLVTK